MAVLLRIAWRSVSGIVGRVVTERAGAVDRLAGLRRIGIDEISYRYVGDPCQGVRENSLMNFCRVLTRRAARPYEASTSSRSRIPSKIF